MNFSKWDKYGVVAVMVAAFFGGIFTESRSIEGSTVFFSVALITLGVLLTMIISDWWIDRHKEQPPTEPLERQRDHYADDEEGHR